MIREKCKWESSTASHVGLVRAENQDRMGEAEIDNCRIYIVADGMGGHKGGAMAAAISTRIFLVSLVEWLPLESVNNASYEASIKNAINDAFERTNSVVYKEAHSENPDTNGMGSTVVMLLIQDSQAYIAHVGDSRAYLYSKGKLKQLTRDHSPVFRMFESGILTSAEARNHPQANIIDRAIGIKPQIDVDISEPFNLAEGDGVLLCSDGLCGYVADDEIESVLRQTKLAKDVADNLIQLALKAGGEDNITVQFIQRSVRSENSWLSKVKNIFSSAGIPDV